MPNAISQFSRVSRAAGGAALILGCASIAHAQAFAGHLVVARTGGAPAALGRVFAAGEKTRIETRDLPDGFFVVDLDQHASWFVRPQLRVFMDAKRSSALTQLFARVEPNNACRRWRELETIAGPALQGGDDWQCELVGPDQVDGRAALKYRISAGPNRSTERWVDPVRRFPIKVAQEDGTVWMLQQVVDAPQPDTLFVVPDGYRKFDPMELIERIKQSDVWVEPEPGKRSRPRGQM
jgi:hypothetical protein